jgi:hypothetical protein
LNIYEINNQCLTVDDEKVDTFSVANAAVTPLPVSDKITEENAFEIVVVLAACSPDSMNKWISMLQIGISAGGNSTLLQNETVENVSSAGGVSKSDIEALSKDHTVLQIAIQFMDLQRKEKVTNFLLKYRCNRLLTFERSSQYGIPHFSNFT